MNPTQSRARLLAGLSGIDTNFSLTQNWPELVKKLDPAHLTLAVSKKDVPPIADIAFENIRTGNTQDALNWLFLGLFCHEKRMLDEIRRRGLFRSSKYDFRTTCLKSLIKGLLKEATCIPLNGESCRYLTSISNLLHIGKSIADLNRSIRRFASRNRNSAFKTIVALVDSLFMFDHEATPTAPSDDWKSYSKEDLAEAASFVIHCFDAEVGIRDTHFNLLDERALARGLYHGLLIKASKVRRFLDAEVLIDAFDYDASLHKRSVRISAPLPEFEMSIRLGYIQNQQADIRSRIEQTQAIAAGGFSIFKAADAFYDHHRDKIVRLLEWPARRYVFMFPDVPEFRSLFQDERLFIEEQIYLKEIIASELATLDEISRFEVADGLTVFDLLKLCRLFTFFRRIAARHLAAIFQSDADLAYRSLVPVFQVQNFENLLGWCLSKEAMRKAIELLSWNSGASTLVDLQYKPILRGEEYYLTPMNITATINWYRNLAYTQKRRIIDIAEEEASSRALHIILSRVTSTVRKGFSTRLREKDIEIDVIARFGEFLFVFECKHALLPCNIHELRTTHDHLKKGAITLSTIAELLSDQETEKEVYKRLGWELEPATDIVTCIVSCNGMFPGISLSGHPVRRWGELQNMIEAGTVRMGIVGVEGNGGVPQVKTDDLIEHKLWSESHLTPEFLRQYLKDDPLRTIMFDAMVEFNRSYHVGDESELVFQTYYIDLLAVKARIETLSSNKPLAAMN